MGVFGAVIEMAPCFLACRIADNLHRGPIGGAFVRHHDMWITVSPHGFLEESQCGSLIPGRCNVRFQHFPFMIDGSPPGNAVGRVCWPRLLSADEDLIQVPLAIGGCVASIPIEVSWSCAAKYVPNRSPQRRTLSWQTSMPRSWRRSSTFLRERGKKRKSDVHYYPELDDFGPRF